MNKKPNIIKVTLCGPSDVSEEIKISREVIAEWNHENFDSTGWGIKDQHWNTDAIPTMAERGQAAINHQLIDESGIVVAIFWTRLGTPTGLAGSGTEEEITRAYHREIPVLAYFSNLEAPASRHDKDQADKLAAFRMRMMNTGFPFTFSSRREFRKLFKDHLKASAEKIMRGAKKEAKPRKPVKTIVQKAEGNTVTNNGTVNGVMAGAVHINNLKVARDQRGKSPRDLPGTVGADADMKSYALYLVGKYIKARQEGEKRVKQYSKPFHPGSAHTILGEGFGVTNSVQQIRQETFFKWVASAQNKIRRTVFCKNLGHEFFHSWEEHLRQRGHDI